jgi:hypothetical protein
MALTEVIDDHVLARYRELADAESAAFDEMEHAYEDGDRRHFEEDFAVWLRAIRAKLAFLNQIGVTAPEAALAG